LGLSFFYKVLLNFFFPFFYKEGKKWKRRQKKDKKNKRVPPSFTLFEDTAMSKSVGLIVLKGVQGLISEEKFRLEPGKVCIVGRSRECDFSLRRSMKYLILTPEERQQEEHFNTVSRKHCSIAYHSNNSLEIEDFSRHGTFVDGKRIHRVLLSDFQKKSYIITVGTQEQFTLTYKSTASAD
jgi:pSer/pThr/pTyr-binding forkhead associated (FHA) protein